MFENLSVSIDIKVLSQTLKALGYQTKHPKPSPLHDLCLVDQFLSSVELPSFLSNRQFALERILIDLLIRHFHYLSALLSVSPPSLDESYEQSLHTIASYAQTGNPELIGWCWLYHRYVRSELNILPKTISNLCHIDERTLRRYHEYALKRFLDVLIQEEWRTRWQQRQQDDRYSLTTRQL